MIKNIAAQKLTQTKYGLGTLNTLTTFGTANQFILERSFELLAWYEDLLTINRAQSQVLAISMAAGKKPVQVSEPVYQLIKMAVTASQANFGFNAAIGPLVKLWDIGFDDAHVPSTTEIQRCCKLIDPTQIQLDDRNFSVYLPQPGMKLDLGGIAKGYIADRIKDLWQAYGVGAGIINLGGNVLLLGTAPTHTDGRWVIGVQDTRQPRGINVGEVILPACSAVTSGIYERSLKQNGRSYHHLLDPRTGYPLETDLAGVTIFAEKSVVAEIEAKRLFFAGQPLPNWLQSRPGLLGAVFVYQDGRVIPVGVKLRK
ncbi:MAG: FAD:protein FMN transferase [Liquorilactobacillus ghanensis]|uniref:FAD:protein FMN transferase n=1 Tax=Liquorilactobacillus ghanensis TaxID=399370 RepID=UPI0039EC96E5